MKLLFLARTYYPKPTAHSICIMNVQKGLLELGVKSDVIILGDGSMMSNEFGDIYFVKGTESLYAKNSFFKKVRFFLTWPFRHPLWIFRYRSLAKKLMHKNRYDAIISDCYPLELPLASTSFKNSILYELDAPTNNPDYGSGVKKILQHRVAFFERVVYTRAAHIIHLLNNKEYFQQKKYKAFSKKSSYVDIPLLSEPTFSTDAGTHTGKFSMIYAGALIQAFRSPAYLMELMIALSKKVEVECSFYSRGNCEEMIKEKAKQFPEIIRQMGYVSQEELAIATQKADFLISIGNVLSGSDTALPSKTISYIASGKPVIHIDGGKNDIAKAYLQKYGMAIILDPQENIDKNVEMLLSFIRDYRGKHADFQAVKEKFYQNTPEYSAKCIINAVNNMKDLKQ